MIEMKLTRFFTCEDANLAYALSFNCKDLDYAESRVKVFAAMKLESMGFPDMSVPGETPVVWREMTDAEALAYMDELAVQDKMERRRVALLTQDQEDEDNG